jgi:two-component system response regulator FlrC
MLAEYFLKKFSADCGKAVTSIAPRTMETLKKSAWTGNIRELENVMERAVLLCRGDTVMPEDLFLAPAPGVAAEAARETAPAAGTVDEMERRLIMGTLEKAGNNRTQAAEMLGISIRTLRNKLNIYKLESKGA